MDVIIDTIVKISIHALHEESDPATRSESVTSCTFQSTLSMRRATGNTAGNVRLIKFQSTLSMRRATRLKQFRSLTAAQFQSTLSMRRATRTYSTGRRTWNYFNPRSP